MVERGRRVLPVDFYGKIGMMEVFQQRMGKGVRF
jgi:hypothetical protein